MRRLSRGKAAAIATRNVLGEVPTRLEEGEKNVGWPVFARVTGSRKEYAKPSNVGEFVVQTYADLLRNDSPAAERSTVARQKFISTNIVFPDPFLEKLVQISDVEQERLEGCTTVVEVNVVGVKMADGGFDLIPNVRQRRRDVGWNYVRPLSFSYYPVWGHASRTQKPVMVCLSSCRSTIFVSRLNARAASSKV
jgi:hypothetical protein